MAMNKGEPGTSMAIRNQSKEEVYPRVILKRLSASVTHPYKCTGCQKRFHKDYEATEHYINTHQNSNSKATYLICRCGSLKRTVRCKKCEGCLTPKCNQCHFCLNPSWKKTCVKRVCPYHVVLKCPCFI